MSQHFFGVAVGYEYFLRGWRHHETRFGLYLLEANFANLINSGLKEPLRQSQIPLESLLGLRLPEFGYVSKRGNLV